MVRRTGAAMDVASSRRYKGKVYRTYLLRRSVREGSSIRKEILVNLFAPPWNSYRSEG